MTETIAFDAMEDWVQFSMSDIESPNTTKQKTEDVCERLQKRHTKLKNKNAKLRRSIVDMNRTVTQEKHIITDLEKRVQRLELELERTLDVNKQQQCDIEKLEKTYSIIYSENAQLEKSLNDMTRNLSQGAKISSDLQQRTESLVLERESILAVNIQLQSDIETLNKMYSNSQWKNGQLEKSLNEMGRTLSQEKETVSDLQNRLSKLAGDLLTHENTNITDLSDPNRPIMLSETYSEIYDNEWTDAFEELTGRGLTDILAIKKLRDMLLCSFRKCRDVTWYRYQILKSTMSTVDIFEVLPSAKDFTESEEKSESTSNESKVNSSNETHNSIPINSEANNKEETCRDLCVSSASRKAELLYQRNIEGERTSQSKKEHLTISIALTVEQEKEIKRIWRTATNALMDESVRNLHILLLTKFDISIEDWPNTSKYLARCIDLCWKMGVQEKPMYLDACDEKSDCCEKIFNHDKYRAYMQSGKRVEFVVWPALFLHEGGAMLVKGIAQGCQ
ncbi:hypothetical protein ACJMK2_031634 [Sinanodonta woodiana]|uniref:Mitochondria-eating protein C-terminal domain-containing protein n=1 Tax=Sinanodonta woodiana TaxID=1069815 RepID=A0ABD3WZD3_SINWO